jgi:hypothetical protein
LRIHRTVQTLRGQLLDSSLVNVTSSNQLNASARSRPFRSASLPWRAVLVLLFSASYGFRPMEPCWAGHHHAHLEMGGTREDAHWREPGAGHRHSEHDWPDDCCASATACATGGVASLTNVASTVLERIRPSALTSRVVFASPLIPDHSWILQGRGHSPPAKPLFITLKTLLI